MFVKVIGTGHFGQVFKVQYTGQESNQLVRNETYALKVVKLPRCVQIKQKSIDLLFNEKKALQMIKGNKQFT